MKFIPFAQVKPGAIVYDPTFSLSPLRVRSSWPGGPNDHTPGLHRLDAVEVFPTGTTKDARRSFNRPPTYRVAVWYPN
jgi:hypothetical protein